MSAERRAFEEYYEALLYRVGRGGHPINEREEHELRSRREAWLRECEAPLPDPEITGIFTAKSSKRPPSWEVIVAKLGLGDLEPPPVARAPKAKRGAGAPAGEGLARRLSAFEAAQDDADERAHEH